MYITVITKVHEKVWDFWGTWQGCTPSCVPRKSHTFSRTFAMTIILLNVCHRTDHTLPYNAGECVHYKSTPSRLVREGVDHTLPHNVGKCEFTVYTLSHIVREGMICAMANIQKNNRHSESPWESVEFPRNTTQATPLSCSSEIPHFLVDFRYDGYTLMFLIKRST